MDARLEWGDDLAMASETIKALSKQHDGQTVTTFDAHGCCWVLIANLTRNTIMLRAKHKSSPLQTPNVVSRRCWLDFGCSRCCPEQTETNVAPTNSLECSKGDIIRPHSDHLSPSASGSDLKVRPSLERKSKDGVESLGTTVGCGSFDRHHLWQVRPQWLWT